MPELPEVQTVVNHLAECITGRSITGTEISWARSIAVPGVTLFSQQLVGKVCRAVSRRGKYIVIALAPHGYLLCHLRMSGDLKVADAAAPRSKHERVRILFEGECELRFDDPRKFGKMYLVADPEEIVGTLGIEPFSRNFTSEALYERLHQRALRVKTLLLDQRCVAGLGNIYAVESLWHAGINPLVRSNKLSKERVVKLRNAIYEVLRKAVDARGTDLGDGVWKSGGYSPKTYGREGQPCRRCKTVIRRVIVNQRSTDFCPKCQSR